MTKTKTTTTATTTTTCRKRLRHRIQQRIWIAQRVDTYPVLASHLIITPQSIFSFVTSLIDCRYTSVCHTRKSNDFGRIFGVYQKRRGFHERWDLDSLQISGVTPFRLFWWFHLKKVTKNKAGKKIEKKIARKLFKEQIQMWKLSCSSSYTIVNYTSQSTLSVLIPLSSSMSFSAVLGTILIAGQNLNTSSIVLWIK